MTLLSRLARVWRNLVQHHRVERDLDDELRAALDLLAAEKTRAGMSPAGARRAAAIELRIESVKQQVRDVRAGSLVDILVQDVHYSLRLLRRYPLFALTAALSLAVRRGANTSVFTIANAVL